jgi:hypothetical protein
LIKFILIFCFSILPLAVQAQGFPWFGGERKPYQVPLWYLGPSIGSSLSATGDEITYRIPESMIIDGNGVSSNSGFGLGAVGEYWIEADQTIRAELTFGFSSITTERSFSEPVAPGRIWTQRNYASISQNSVSLNLMYKKRILGYLSAIGGIKNSVVFSSVDEHVLESLDEELMFNGTQRELAIEGTELYEYSSFEPGVSLGLNYDYPLWKGVYISPSLTGEYRIGLQGGNPSYWRVELGVAMLFGLD